MSKCNFPALVWSKCTWIDSINREPVVANYRQIRIVE